MKLKLEEGLDEHPSISAGMFPSRDAGVPKIRRERLSRVLFREEGQVFARPVSFAALRQQKRHLQNLRQLHQQKQDQEKKAQEDQERLLKTVYQSPRTRLEDLLSLGTIERGIYYTAGGQTDLPSVSVSTLSPTSSRSLSSSSPSGTSTSHTHSPVASSYHTSNSFSSVPVSPLSPLPSSPQPSQYSPSPRFLAPSPSPAFSFPGVQPLSVPADSTSENHLTASGSSDPASTPIQLSPVPAPRLSPWSPVVSTASNVSERTLPMGGNSSTSLTLTSPLILSPRLSASLPASPNDPYNSLPSFIYKYHFPEPPKPPKHLRIQEPPPEDGARQRVLDKILSLRPAVVQDHQSESGPTAFCPSDFIKDCLAAHNLYRKRHGAAPLSMDPKLCQLSQSWANQISHTGIVQYRADPDIGENVYCRTERRIRGKLVPVLSGDQVAATWYSNIRSYKFNKAGEALAACAGSFSQMVWCSSRRFGVGMAVNVITGKSIVVAYYTPPGNLSGGFQKNVRPLNTKVLAAEILDRQQQEMEQRRKEELEQEQILKKKKESKSSKLFFSRGNKCQSVQEETSKSQETQAGADLGSGNKEPVEHAGKDNDGTEESDRNTEFQDPQSTLAHLTNRGSPLVDLKQPEPNSVMDVTATDDVYDTCGNVKVRGVLGAQRRNISGRNATKIFAAHLLGHASSVVVPPGQDPQVVIYIRKKGRWLAGSCSPGGLGSPGSSGGGGIAEGLGGMTMLTTLHATAPAKARMPTEMEKTEAEERKEKEKEMEKERKERIKRVLDGDTVKSLVKHSISFSEADVIRSKVGGNTGGGRRLQKPVIARRRNTITSGAGYEGAGSSGIKDSGHLLCTRRHLRGKGSVGRDAFLFSNDFSDIRGGEEDQLENSSIAEMWRNEMESCGEVALRTIDTLVEGNESAEESEETSDPNEDEQGVDIDRDMDDLNDEEKSTGKGKNNEDRSEEECVSGARDQEETNACDSNIKEDRGDLNENEEGLIV